MIRILFGFLFLVAVIDAKSQNPKADNFCQYLNQPIQKLVANLKTNVADTRVSSTSAGNIRSLQLVFDDSSYFEIFLVFSKTNTPEQFTLKNYRDYKIKCLFYHVPGEVPDPCGCRSFSSN